MESLGVGLTVIRAALDAGVPRVVLAGSCLEGVVIEPESVYARTKRCLHDIALSPAVQARLSTVCAHIFSPYGPWEHPGRAVPSVILALLRGEPIPVSSGATKRDYIHVSDVASALSALAENSVGGSVDVCTGRTVRLHEVFTTIATEVGRPELLEWGEEQVGPGENFDVAGDPSVLRFHGWIPQFDLRDGIRDAVVWWRSQMAMRGTP